MHFVINPDTAKVPCNVSTNQSNVYESLAGLANHRDASIDGIFMFVSQVHPIESMVEYSHSVSPSLMSHD